MEFSLLWCFLTVCGFVQVACHGFLVREACVDVLVDGAVFLLSESVQESPAQAQVDSTNIIFKIFTIGNCNNVKML